MHDVCVHDLVWFGITKNKRASERKQIVYSCYRRGRLLDPCVALNFIPSWIACKLDADSRRSWVSSRLAATIDDLGTQSVHRPCPGLRSH